MRTNNKLNKMLRNYYYLKIETNTQSLMQKYKTFIKTLINTYHHQQKTQVSWLSTIMTQKTSLMIRKIFASISADSYVDTRATKSKQIPTKLELYNWMEDQTNTCSPKSLCSIISYLKSVTYKYSMAASLWKRFGLVIEKIQSKTLL